MTKNLSIEDYKNILSFYNIKKPNNLFNIKKRANIIIINKMCNSNFNDNKKIKQIILILNKKKVLSFNKKNKNKNKRTVRVSYFRKNTTRILSPINYLCT